MDTTWRSTPFQPEKAFPGVSAVANQAVVSEKEVAP
jgi:hypothetical protein